MKILCVVLAVIFTAQAKAQNYEAFQIFDSKGKKVSVEKMMKATTGKEYVFFGEYHDNPISHWLQLETTAYMFKKSGTNLQLAFEMFEQDQQQLLDDYLNGKVSAKEFKDSCRLWPNYKTDYKPLIDFAKDSSLYCIASNVPRTYANLLFKSGRAALDTLSDLEKSWIAPLDFTIDTTLSQYAALLEMASHMGGGNLMEAQALKDATMAHFILKYKKENNVVLHMNGAYHSDFYQGIMWYIRQKDKEAEILTISTVSQSDFSKLDKEHIGRADYIICVNSNMTSTH